MSKRLNLRRLAPPPPPSRYLGGQGAPGEPLAMGAAPGAVPTAGQGFVAKSAGIFAKIKNTIGVPGMVAIGVIVLFLLYYWINKRNQPDEDEGGLSACGGGCGEGCGGGCNGGCGGYGQQSACPAKRDSCGVRHEDCAKAQSLPACPSVINSANGNFTIERNGKTLKCCEIDE